MAARILFLAEVLPPDAHDEVAELLAAARVVDDFPPLGEGAEEVFWRPEARSWGVLARRDDGTLMGFGLLSPLRDGYGIEVVVHPAHRHQGTEVRSGILEQARLTVARTGGGHLRYWAPAADASTDAAAASAGLVARRDLLQMRVPLPLESTVRRQPPLRVRAFRVGIDDGPWLDVNNRAFAEHPEQGGWDHATLAGRFAEPWFDPEGFLLYEDQGRLVGSCWTKVHADTQPVQGEIYVISVDPEHHGGGLGRALTIAGLDWLAGQGIGLGMLYVDGANAAAVHLYRALGFWVHHTDRAYEADVAPGA